MYTKQLSVFLGNKPGRLLEVCRLLGRAGVDIKAANIAESKDYGILRLIVDKCDEALAAVKAGSFSGECTQVVAVEVPDRPGGLAQVLETIEKVGLNIEYMYGFSIRHSDCALMGFRFDDAENASKALSAAGVGIVTCGK